MISAGRLVWQIVSFAFKVLHCLSFQMAMANVTWAYCVCTS